MALYNPNEQYGYATTAGTPAYGDDSGGSSGVSGMIQLPNGQIVDSSMFQNNARMVDEQGNTYQSVGTSINPNYTDGLTSLQQGPDGQWYLNEADFAKYGTRLPKDKD